MNRYEVGDCNGKRHLVKADHVIATSGYIRFLNELQDDCKDEFEACFWGAIYYIKLEEKGESDD